jgi:hypothetical protein
VYAAPPAFTRHTDATTGVGVTVGVTGVFVGAGVVGVAVGVIGVFVFVNVYVGVFVGGTGVLVAVNVDVETCAVMVKACVDLAPQAFV